MLEAWFEKVGADHHYVERLFHGHAAPDSPYNRRKWRERNRRLTIERIDDAIEDLTCARDTIKNMTVNENAPRHEINSTGQTVEELAANCTLSKAVATMLAVMFFVEYWAGLNGLGGSKNPRQFLTWPDYVQPDPHDRTQD